MGSDRPSIELLVVAAHPDDAEICVGGSLLIARERGLRTAVVDLTRGELSSRGDPETRRAETDRATALLGLTYRANLDLGDGAVRDTDAARRALVGEIRELRPRVVLAPWPDDLHPDHAGAGELVHRTYYLTGVHRFAPGKARAYRPAALGFYMGHTPFEPSVVVDISAVWERKLEVIRAYASQFHRPGVAGAPTKISRPDFPAFLEGRAREHGLRAGVEFGEPIRWLDPPAVADPASWIVGSGLGSRTGSLPT
jgi:bacillithiol biosynthesis deacetylase BshB1